MSRKGRRLTLIGVALGVLAFAVGIVLFALSDSIAYFATPTDIAARAATPSQRIRLGGLVKPGTVVRGEGLAVAFAVTDGKTDLPVRYTGILPDLFRDGQGVVAEGRIENGVFLADTIFAKHDERYVPREVADAMKKQGVWKEPGKPHAPGPATGETPK